MVNNIQLNQSISTQTQIDLIAKDLMHPASQAALPSPELCASLLDLCPEQDVWMYEPDPSDPAGEIVFATFLLQSSRGIIFHMSCQLAGHGEILEWIGPFDVITPQGKALAVVRALAA